MATIFDDDFETGDISAWTGTANSGTSTTQTVEGGAAKNGSFGLKEVANSGSDTSDERYVFQTGLAMAEETNWGFDFYFQHAAHTNIGYGGVGAKTPIEMIVDDGGNVVCWIPLIADLELGFAYKDQGFSDLQLGSGTLTIVTGTWYLLRFKATNINTTAHTADLEFLYSSDGGQNFTSITSDTGISWRGAHTPGGLVDEVRFGHNHHNNFEQARYTWYLDDLIIWQTTAPTYGGGGGQPFIKRFGGIPGTLNNRPGSQVWMRIRDLWRPIKMKEELWLPAMPLRSP